MANSYRQMVVLNRTIGSNHGFSPFAFLCPNDRIYPNYHREIFGKKGLKTRWSFWGFQLIAPKLDKSWQAFRISKTIIEKVTKKWSKNTMIFWGFWAIDPKLAKFTMRFDIFPGFEFANLYQTMKNWHFGADLRWGGSKGLFGLLTSQLLGL